MTTLADLLQPRARTDLEAMLMAVLQTAPIDGMPGVAFPTTDWQPGSFERTFLKMVATGLADREDTLKMLAAGGFLQLASSLFDADGNPIEGWMELLAAQNFGRTRNAATYTRQLLTLTCTSGPGPYTRGPGELIAYAPATGNRYVNVDSVTIPDGGSVTAIFQADGPGVGYQDSAGSIVALTTPLPGVSVNNALTPSGQPASYLAGSGSIAVTSSTITTSRRTVKLVFTVGGRVSDHSATFTCTVYTGSSIVTTGPFSASATFTQGDATLTLTDGASSTQSFSAGDEWIIGLPGTPILQAGADKETLGALMQRCLDRWAAQSAIPTGNRYEGMVRDCEAAQHLGVTKVKTAPSATIAGIEDVFIAGPTATATSGQVAAVQGYLDERSSDVDMANVVAAAAVPVSMTGTVRCRRGTISAVQAAANLAWATYIAELELGGERPDGIVKVLALENILNDAGAYNAFALSLNGGSDVVLLAYQCATVDGTTGLPSTGLTWQEVA